MENEILFSEKQKFNQWWLWLILLGVNCFMIIGILQQVFFEKQFGDKPMNNYELLLTAGVTLSITLLFFNFRLDTQIKKDGIYVRFFPLQLKFKHYTWENISKSYVRKYSPIIDYGGWGLRIGLFRKGRAMNVSGNKGLQLEFTDKKKLLIGTNKAEELTDALNKIGKYNQ